MKNIRQVMLVEDSPVDRIIAQTLLRKNYPELEVQVAGNGRQALDQLLSSPHPDLILLDLDMPVMNGWDFLTEVARLPEGPQLIGRTAIVSSSIDPKENLMAKQLGINWFIPKPITVVLIESVMRAVLHNVMN